MINYLTTDTLPEIVDKNKSNILYLLQEFAYGGISYKDLVTKVEANAVTAAKAVSDAAAAQAKADSHDQPIIANAAAALAAQQKADQNAADIVKAVADINANAASIARIINDGIGGYLGTYRATDGDDFTVLPQSANDKERAITEFPENDEIFYQEWEWKTPGGWTKLGSKTDSHIHSQSAGISLSDVAAQQDPKIAKVLEPYMDQEITITPAIYGWKTIDQKTYAFSIDDVGKKTRIFTGSEDCSSGTINSFSGRYFVNCGIRFALRGTAKQDLYWRNSSPDELAAIAWSTDGTITINLTSESVSKFEIWDIITPAVKATVLVKK